MGISLSRFLAAAFFVAAVTTTGSAQAQCGGFAWILNGGIGVSYHLHVRNSDERLLLFASEIAKPLGKHWEYELEGFLSRMTSPPGYLVGLLPAGVGYLPLTGRVQPYVSVDLGFGWTDVTNIPEISRRFNFLLQGNLGARWSTGEHRSMQISGTFLHISNGGTRRPNLGLNVVALLVGWRIR